MTAINLIESIFRRAPWKNEPGDMRHITRAQLDYLRNLISAGPEGGAVTRGGVGSLVWMPKGRYKYILTEDPRGNKHTLTRLSSLAALDIGSLF